MLSPLLAVAMVVTVEPAVLPMRTPPSIARVSITAPGVEKVRVWASTGTIGAPRSVGPGRFEASYTPPTSSSPGAAVIGAWEEGGAQAGAQVVSLLARSALPIETEPGAQVSALAGGRRATARADASGRARLGVWIAPGTRSLRVTAHDRAGNETREEVAIDAPRAAGIWIVDPDPSVRPAGTPRRLFVFFVGASPPRVSVDGAEVASVVSSAVSTVLIRPGADATVVAEEGEPAARAVLTLKVARPAAQKDRSVSLAPTSSRSPRWELGASAGPRLSAAFIGAALSVTGLRRIRGSRVHLGVDLTGHYAGGSTDGVDVELGGASLRLRVEVRFGLGARVALYLAGAAGGSVVRERRVETIRAAYWAVDGGPALELGAGVLTRLGEGLLAIQLGYAWSPLVRLGLANLEGGVISLGYRAARW